MMKKFKVFTISGLLVLFLTGNFWGLENEVQAQGTALVPKDWFLKDPEVDKVQGLSVEKAYSLLTGKPSKTVIVAVMDTGVDFDHEDLKDVM